MVDPATATVTWAITATEGATVGGFLIIDGQLKIKNTGAGGATINRLRHPNIVAVYDFGQLPDHRFFLSMEYAQGRSVFQLLRRDDHFDVRRALWVLGQLVYAVHHAHSRGVVHRDLKPDNLLLCGEDETLKVLDFGVAKVAADEGLTRLTEDHRI